MKHKRIYLIVVYLLISFTLYSQSSLELDGLTGYINFPHDESLNINGDFTLEAWIKPSDVSGEITLFIKGNNGQCGNYGMFINNGRLAYVSDGACSWDLSIGQQSIIEEDVWQHVAAVGSGTTVKLYINGVMTDELIMPSIVGPLNGDELWIGRSVFTTTNFLFDGLMDEVRIWTKAKTEAEISDQIYTELSGLEDNLIAYYKFDEISDECDIKDCSSFENHGFRNTVDNSTSLPILSTNQPTTLTDVECGVQIVNCISFQSEFQLFVEELKLNLEAASSNIFLNDQGDVTEAITSLQYYYTNRDQIVDEFYDFLVSLGEEFPLFFKINQQIDDKQFKYLGSLREQVHIYLRDYLRDYPDKETQFLSALDLTAADAQLYLEIWEEHEILIVDNYSLSSEQLNVIYEIMATLSEDITDLGVILYREFYTDDYQNLISITQSVSAINSFGNPLGTWTGNGFPTDFEEFISDQFAIALSHEICHTIDADYITFNSRLLNWKDALLAAAGNTSDEYLRSLVLDTGGSDFFQVNPQEFFASLANVYFSNSQLTLDLAIERFAGGFQQPINQFLLIADALSAGSGSTQFYEIDQGSNITITSHQITRNNEGFITTINVTETCKYEFVYDVNDFVTAVTVPASEECDDDLITSIEDYKNDQIEVYPNPASDYVYLDYPAQAQVNAKLFDLSGRFIFEEVNNPQINVMDLVDGVYLLELEGSHLSRKVLQMIFVVH